MGKIRLGVYAAAHFLVDLGCAVLILGRVCPEYDPMTAILLYNLFAFAVQMPVGLLADRLGKSHLFAAAGCLLVAAGWLLPSGIPAVVAAGLGNAAFHVGGGLYALYAWERKAGPVGLFVSTGAFGVFLGTWYVDSILQMSNTRGGSVSTGGIGGAWSTGVFGGFWPADGISGIWPAAVLILTVVAIVLLLLGEGAQNATFSLPVGSKKLWGVTAALLAVVVLRSLLGLTADMPWRTGFGQAMAAVCAVAGGKAVGGFLADRFGRMPTAVASLGLATVCFLGCQYKTVGLAALFLFNMTMPVTLRALADLFPGAKGFSFGLLTFGLFLGFLPVYFGCGSLNRVILAVGSLLSLLLLAAGLRGAGDMAKTGDTPKAGCGAKAGGRTDASD